MTFDGFGGHAKLDQFPRPKMDYSTSSTSFVKKNKMETKRKRSDFKLDTGNNQKLSDMFVIDDETNKNCA